HAATGGPPQGLLGVPLLGGWPLCSGRRQERGEQHGGDQRLLRRGALGAGHQQHGAGGLGPPAADHGAA
ncbi:unnamed protein product, partial [Heterosigma akashiwo]